MSYFTVEDTFQFLDKIPSGNLLEFGVFSGNCLNRLIKASEISKRPFEKVYGFDSFAGLPEETPGVLENPDWKPGVFSSQVHFNVSSVEEAIEKVRENIERKDIELIKGFFNKSLTSELGNKLTNSGSYIHIDVDMHSSTVEVLNFLFTYKIPKIGSLIRYDDWIWSGYSLQEYTAGNSLAHIQAEFKYGMKFNRVASNIYQLMDY